MTQEIIEGNKIIMEFDGWVKKPMQTFDPDNNKQNPGSNTYFIYERNGVLMGYESIETEVVYSTSWDWLMDACKKWDGLPFKKTDNKRKDYEKLCDDLDNAVTRYEILPAFEQLVNNIKWLNQNNK